MSPRRHPPDDTLAAFASGSLAPGSRLVIESHVQVCPECRMRVRACEAVGGALLDEVEPAAAPADLLDRVWTKIERRARAPAVARAEGKAPFPGAPEILRRCQIGPWRFIQPGLRIAMVTPEGEAEASAMLLRVAAGRQMPVHTHTGVEYTQVLTGAYTDENGRYEAGDYDEADGDVLHQPHAEPQQECICLSAVEGRLRLASLVGRLAQSLFGF